MHFPLGTPIFRGATYVVLRGATLTICVCFCESMSRLPLFGSWKWIAIMMTIPKKTMPLDVSCCIQKPVT